ITFEPDHVAHQIVPNCDYRRRTVNYLSGVRDIVRSFRGPKSKKAIDVCFGAERCRFLNQANSISDHAAMSNEKLPIIGRQRNREALFEPRHQFLGWRFTPIRKLKAQVIQFFCKWIVHLLVSASDSSAVLPNFYKKSSLRLSLPNALKRCQRYR